MPHALENLPPEILHLILGHLGIECCSTDKIEWADAHFRRSLQKPNQPSWSSLKLQPLLSLCLVSKHLCHAVQPILCCNFAPGYGDSWHSRLYTWDGRLLSFLGTVARRRDLAKFVKRIHILPHLLQASREAVEKEKRNRQRMWEEYIRGLPQDERLRLPSEPPTCPISVSDHLQPPQPELRQAIGEEEARDTLREVAIALRLNAPEQRVAAKDLVTLLIAALPKLEHCSLFLGPPSYMMSVTSAALLTAELSQLPLRTLSLSVLRTEEKRFDLDRNVRLLFEVSPCLETLNLHKCYGIQQQQQQAATLPLLPRLKHIRITCSRLNEQGLKLILNSCNNLCSFTYEAGPHFVDDGSAGQWDCSDHFRLRSAARYLTRHHHHRKTLQSVHIDLRNRGGDPVTTPSPFSFRELTALKHLFLNLDEFHSMFFLHPGTDDSTILTKVLPDGLSSLHLAGRIGEDLPRLERGLFGLGEAAVEGRFQHLKEVRWDINARLHTEDAVRALLAVAGIDFAYDSWPESRMSAYHGDSIPPANFENQCHAFPDCEDDDL
ncbi:hypothetical protein ASPBRDRAFT_25257 [Aspergillus brasiliensis CBS 101740]|uniref:F-box domain-containing protein n=1 Tax=Aspergillus brasiliensis (strain CBS 101740 / IMI 381727 / IBT 21946) TaxID=767769 RepID=A0A1L9V123_ASPBC|nr:hypothetical protein ASPBRDRAFT_25257 [Aspergillus brasiliensis CBS 101740]